MAITSKFDALVIKKKNTKQWTNVMWNAYNHAKINQPNQNCAKEFIYLVPFIANRFTVSNDSINRP